ncbi:MAG: bacillithiol system redox-active protein YtxJ [Sporosarcina sp.]
MKELKTADEWNDVLEQSKKEPLLVLKHSTTCPISAAAFKEFDSVTTDVPKHYLKVRESRPVSNEIESDLQIAHESPQLFLLKDGKAVWQATHYSISQSQIEKAVEEHGNK